MNWRFWERRESSAFSDALIAAMVRRADDNTLANVNAVAALEAAAGTVGRGFSAAEVSGPDFLTAALTPDVLEMVGRAMVRRGEYVAMIDTSTGALAIRPASSWDVQGGYRAEDWTYRLTLSAPNAVTTFDDVPAQSVIHVRYAADPSRPYHGQSPIDVAYLSGQLSANTLQQLSNEAGGPVGRTMEVPRDGGDAELNELIQEIKDAKGGVVTVEGGDWDNAGSGASMTGKTYRFGGEPPDSMVALHQEASNEIYAAVGFNPALFTAGDSASLRESWRLALFNVIGPLSGKLQAELRLKVDAGITLSFQELRSSDLSGRARAMQSMVNGGMAVADAVAVAGLMVEDA